MTRFFSLRAMAPAAALAAAVAFTLAAPEGRQLPLEALDYLLLRGPVRASPLLDPFLAELRPLPRMLVGMWVCQVAETIRGRFEYAPDVTGATSPSLIQSPLTCLAWAPATGASARKAKTRAAMRIMKLTAGCWWSGASRQSS